MLCYWSYTFRVSIATLCIAWGSHYSVFSMLFYHGNERIRKRIYRDFGFFNDVLRKELKGREFKILLFSHKIFLLNYSFLTIKLFSMQITHCDLYKRSKWSIYLQLQQISMYLYVNENSSVLRIATTRKI